MGSIKACLLAFLLLSATISSAQAQRTSKPELVVVEERDAVGLIDKTKIANCIHLVAHVMYAANHLISPRDTRIPTNASDSEVDDHRRPVIHTVAEDHHVSWLDIAMNNAPLVGVS